MGEEKGEIGLVFDLEFILSIYVKIWKKRLKYSSRFNVESINDLLTTFISIRCFRREKLYSCKTKQQFGDGVLEH